MKVSKIVPFAFLSPFIAAYLVFGLFPVIYSFYISLMDWKGYGEMKFVGFDNYVFLFSSSNSFFFKSVWNTFLFIVAYLPLQIIVGMLIASFLYSRWVRWKGFFQLVNFFPYIIIPVAVGLIFSMLFDWQTGIINRLFVQWGWITENINWLGTPLTAWFVITLMMFWKGLGYTMVFYLAGLSSISKEIYEAAWVDGASASRSFFQITIPLLKSVTFFVVITGVIGGFQLLDEPMLLLRGMTGNGSWVVGGPDRVALTTVWYMYDTAFGTNSRFGLSAAIAFGLAMVIAVASVLGYRFHGKEEQS
jgi:cellobiose transport system permease protein